MSSLSSALERMELQNDDELELEDSVFTPSQVEKGDAADEAASETSADDMTCAICLDRTALTEIALVKGCEHQYCVNCILQWALCKEWCPQCKKPFDYLLCHKQLDGTLSDFLVEESVVLLKRARWFDDHMREVARKGAMPAGLLAASSNAAGAGYDSDADARDWADVYEDYLDAELEEDEEIEQYYFSSAAGRARVLGNRRWGEGGYMRAGRMYARPVQNTARTPNAAGGKAVGGKAAAGKAAASSTSGGAGSSRAAAAEASSSSSTSAAAPSGGESSSAAAASVDITNRAGGSRSNGAAAAASSSSWAAATAASSSSNRSRPVAAWLGQDDDDDDEDFCLDREDFPYAMGGSGGSGRAGSSQRRSGTRARPDRPAGMAKPLRQVPKSSPACSMAAGPLVSPLGKSPGGGGFQVGSWGGSSAGGCSGSYGASGSTPGSGRRAKRNARRAVQDAGYGDGPEYD
ncbi:hypothetical protein COO60DRAFT_1282794 [Scenedesmus sp. NREL 46B-D3]|nr:hypothetical protein COO60DRAFT_1282794 [Scenedesmus sp. NREL 46B-D3]